MATRKALKRRAPTPKVKPPKARPWAAKYNALLQAYHRAWSEHVIDACKVQLGSRHDSIESDLLAEFGPLIRALGLDKFLRRMGNSITRVQANYLKRVANIPVSGVAPAAQLEVWRQENLSLIRSLAYDQIQEVGDIIRPAQAQGLRWEDVAEQIQTRLGVGSKRARLIARDQTNKWNGAMMRQTQTDAGITSYRWSTAKDDAVRGKPGGVYAKSKENHYALEGTVHTWDNPPVIPGTNVRSHPGQRIQCRCVAVPVVPWLEGTPDAVSAPVREAPEEVPHDAIFGTAEHRPELVRVGAIERVGGLGSANYSRTGYRESSFTSVRAADPAKLPPVTVDLNTPRNGGVVLVDGRHRLAVALERSEKSILAHVRQRNKAGDIVATRLSRVPTGAR